MLNLVYHIKNSSIPLKKLAVNSGISEERLNAILNESASPTMSDVRKLSKALNLSIDFLISENSQYQEINILFRSAIIEEKDKYNADKFSHIIGNAISILKDYKSPGYLFENFPQGDNNYENAENLAVIFRNIFLQGDLVSPILNLPSILSEKLNCIIYITDLGRDVDGASAIIDQVPFIFVAPRFEPRMLFTLAHEFGHLIAHHKFDVNFATFDKNIFGKSSDVFKVEAFANAFASCLLLPREGIGLTLKKIREHFKIDGPVGDIELLYMSRIYWVSFDVAAKRVEDLGFFPKGGAASLSKEINRNHGSPEKRAEELGLPERPEIEFPKVSANLIKSALKKINSGEVSVGKASEILAIPIAEMIYFNSLQSS